MEPALAFDDSRADGEPYELSSSEVAVPEAPPHTTAAAWRRGTDRLSYRQSRPRGAQR